MISIFYLFIVKCDLFMNEEFENFLNEKRDVSSKSSLVENFTDMFSKTNLYKPDDDNESLVVSKLAPPDQGKPPGGDKKGGDQGKPPGGDKKGGDQGKPPGGDKKGGDQGKPPGGDQKGKEGGDDDVSIQQIKVKDKDAVLVKSQKGGDKPTIVVLADESLMQNQEALKKLPEEIGGQGGDKKDDKPPGGDKKDGKPPGGDKKDGKPPGGDKKDAKPPGGDAKTPPPGKGSPLVSLTTEDNTIEGSESKNKLDLLLGKDKDDNSKDAFWTTVMIDDTPKKVLVNVKTFTVLESMENTKGKSKEKEQEKKDKGIMPTFDFSSTKKVDSKKDESEKEEIKSKKDDEKNLKDGAKSVKGEAKIIKEDAKNKKEDAKNKKEDAKNKLEDAKNKNADEKNSKDDSKKTEDSKKKKDGSKKDDEDGLEDELKKKKEDAKDKKEDKKGENIRYETKEYDKSKSSDNESIWSSILNLGNDSDKYKANKKRLDGKEKDLKIDTNVISTSIAVLNKLNHTTTIKQNDPIKKEGKDNKADNSVSIGKTDDKDLKKEEKDKKDKDKKEKEKDLKKESKEADKDKKEKEKDLKKESKEADKDKKDNDKKEKEKDNKTGDKNESSDNSRKAIESVIFQGGDKDMKSLSSKNANKPSKKNNEASVDDLLYVLKNMPGKVNINKEGKEIYIEGDFFAPKDKKLGQNSFNFSGVLKSKEGKK
jgi:hypothetical protein